jgi:hypothetical protein
MNIQGMKCTDTGKYCFMVEDTLKALELGAVEEPTRVVALALGLDARVLPAITLDEHLVLEAGGQRDDPWLFFVRSQECEASLVRSGDGRDDDRTDEEKRLQHHRAL